MNTLTVAVLLASVIVLGGGIATADAQLTLPDISDKRVNVDSTLRIPIEAQNATWPVTYSIDPLAGARIHPVSGDLVYVPHENHSGTTQTIMVHADDGAQIVTTAIDVRVGGKIGFVEIDGYGYGNNGWLTGNDHVNGCWSYYAENVRNCFARGSTASPGARNAMGILQTASHPIVEGALYYYVIAPFAASPDWNRDRNIYHKFTHTVDGSDVIPNPNSRPAPVAPSFNQYVLQDTAVTIDPQLVGIDGGSVTITEMTAATKGSRAFADATNTTITYTPNTGATGTDQINYTVIDDRGVTSTGTIDIHIITTLPTFTVPASDPAIVFDERATDSFEITVTNDDSAEYVLGATFDPASEGARIYRNGTFAWTPPEQQADDAAYTITISLTVRGHDPVTRQVMASVNKTNSDPEFDLNTSPTTQVREPFDYVAAATEIDIPEQTVSYTIISQNPAGNPASINSQNGTIIWTPVTVENRTITVRASDGQTPEGTADITLTVTVLPEPVIAENDRITATGLETVTVPVLDNDTPADGLVIINVTSNLAPEHDAAFGNVTVASNQTHLVYEPGPAATTLGVEGSHTYTVRGVDNNTDTADLRITIEPPLATISIDTISMAPDAVFNITAYAQNVTGRILEGNNTIYNFTDITAPETGATPAPESVTVTNLISGTVYAYQFARTADTGYAGDDVITGNFTAERIILGSLESRTTSEGTAHIYPIPLSNPAGYHVTWSITSDDQGAIIDDDGIFRWTPGEEYGGATHPFDFEAVAQGANTVTGTLSVTVTETNQDPVFDDITTPIAIVDDVYALNVTATDGDEPPQSLTYSITSESPATPAAAINSGNGTITWTPDMPGTKMITISVSDDFEPSGTATRDIVITVRDSLPVASATIDPADRTFTITAYSQDPISGRILDDAGMVIYNFTGIASATSDMPQSVTTITPEFDPPLEPGNYAYQFARTADANYTGNDVFNGMFTVFLPPVAPEEFVTATLNMQTTITPDIGSPAGLNVSITAAFGAERGNIDITLLDQGQIVYTPTLAGNDTITYTVRDTAGGMTNGTITVFTSAPGNNLPVLDMIDDMEVSVEEELRFTVTANDTDGDSLTFGILNEPQGAAINATTGDFSWTPEASQTGDHPITITVSDGPGGSDSQVFTVTVLEAYVGPNQNPAAPDILINAELHFPSAVTPAVTDPDGDNVTITRVSEPTLGVLDTSMLPQISYTPGQTGIDRLTYTASDGRRGTDTGTITIFINPEGNARPVLEHIYNVGGRVGVDLNFTAAAADGEGDPLTFDLANAPDGANITTGGDFSWRPAESQNGTHTVTFVVHDDSGGADWQHVLVTVLRANETNLPPVPQDIDAGVVLGGGRGFQPVIDDPENDVTEIVRVYDSSLGDVDRSFTSQGIIVYIAGVLGDDEVIYTVSDGRGGFANGTISITVEEPANVRPLIEFVGDKSVNAGDELTFAVDARDLDGLVTGFELEGATQGPSMSPQGVFSWTPTANDVGRHEFTILVFDDAGDNSTVSITVTVRPEGFENSPPVAPDVVIMTPQDVLSIVRPTLTDPDEGDPVRISETGQTTKGRILSGFLRAGIIIYLPNQGESGTETIPYTIADSSDGNDTATINVFISARGNTDPILGSIDFRNINAGQPLGFDLETVDPDNDTVSYQLVGAPDGTEISPEGAFSWTPTAADVGNHTFTVIAYDDRGGADSKSAVVRVLPAGTANQDPNAPDSAVTVAPGGSIVITPAISDPDGDRVTITDAVASGTGVVIQSEDSINYIHVATTPTETITYTVTDARGAMSTGTITVTVQ